MKRIKDIEGLSFIVSGIVPVTATGKRVWSLNIGSLTLTSKDGKRNYILDSTTTEMTPNAQGIGFSTVVRVDKEIFPVTQDNNYRLIFDDLLDCDVTFYCDDEDDNFMVDKGRFLLHITSTDNMMLTKPITLE